MASTANGHAQLGLTPEEWMEPISSIPPTMTPPAASPPPDRAPSTSDTKSAAPAPTLIIPERVALMLDTALHGDRAPTGSLGPDGKPRHRNLAILVGTIHAVKTDRRRKTITELGVPEYKYELAINEILGDESLAEHTSYRLPLTMTDAVRAKAQDLLISGTRVALLGPIGMEEYYDDRFRVAYDDAGRRTWDIRLDVLDVQPVDSTMPDLTWVQFEGEVVAAPVVYRRMYGNRRDLVQPYAGVMLRYRQILPASMGRVVRPVVKSLPVEVMINAGDPIIPNTDALLRPGNQVRIEGRFNPVAFRLPRRTVTDPEIRAALQRETERIRARTQTLPPAIVDRIIAEAHDRLLLVRRMHVEVGYIELLSGTPADPGERERLLSSKPKKAPARSRRNPNRPDPATVQAITDQAVIATMRTEPAPAFTPALDGTADAAQDTAGGVAPTVGSTVHDEAEDDQAADDPPPVASADHVRPRRRVRTASDPDRTGDSGPVQEPIRDLAPAVHDPDSLP